MKWNWIATKIIIYHENWTLYNIWNSRYKIEANKLLISPLLRNSLWYEYDLKGFKIHHDIETNETILIKIKK